MIRSEPQLQSGHASGYIVLFNVSGPQPVDSLIKDFVRDPVAESFNVDFCTDDSFETKQDWQNGPWQCWKWEYTVTASGVSRGRKTKADIEAEINASVRVSDVGCCFIVEYGATDE